MPRGDKSKYSGKQKRQAEHIEKGYEKRGVSEGEAERRAWATVNKMTGGGKRAGGSGRGKKTNKAPARKGGRAGGRAAANAQLPRARLLHGRPLPRASAEQGPDARAPRNRADNVTRWPSGYGNFWRSSSPRSRLFQAAPI